MNTSGLQPLQFNTTPDYKKAGKHGGPPPPPQGQGKEGDSVQISSQAMQKLLANLPDSVTSAASDLQGEQTNLTSDLQTIGQYFESNGGRKALDAYMKSNFSEDQLKSFAQAMGGDRAGGPPPPPQDSNLPDSVTSALSSLKSGSSKPLEDLKSIRDYFMENGGQEALSSFMQSNFSQDQLDSLRQRFEHRQTSTASSNTNSVSSL